MTYQLYATLNNIFWFPEWKKHIVCIVFRRKPPSRSYDELSVIRCQFCQNWHIALWSVWRQWWVFVAIATKMKHTSALFLSNLFSWPLILYLCGHVAIHSLLFGKFVFLHVHTERENWRSRKENDTSQHTPADQPPVPNFMLPSVYIFCHDLKAWNSLMPAKWHKLLGFGLVVLFNIFKKVSILWLSRGLGNSSSIGTGIA